MMATAIKLPANYCVGTPKQFWLVEVWTKLLKVICGIMHHDVSSSFFRPCKVMMWGHHGSDSITQNIPQMLSWTEISGRSGGQVNSLTSLSYFSLHSFLCSRVIYPSLLSPICIRMSSLRQVNTWLSSWCKNKVIHETRPHSLTQKWSALQVRINGTFSGGQGSAWTL